MIKAVIFDMDGVLINSQEQHYKIDLLTLKEIGTEGTRELVEKFAGTRTGERFEKFREVLNFKTDIKTIIDIHTRLRDEVFENDGVEVIDGVIDLIDDIRKNNILTAVASSSSYDLIYFVLDKMGARNKFDVVLSGSDMERGKPAPDIFLAAAEKLGVKADECLVIEDSGNGVEAASCAKMKIVGYINPTSGKQDLSKANKCISDYRKINWEYLKNI